MGTTESFSAWRVPFYPDINAVSKEEFRAHHWASCFLVVDIDDCLVRVFLSVLTEGVWNLLFEIRTHVGSVRTRNVETKMAHWHRGAHSLDSFFGRSLVSLGVHCSVARIWLHLKVHAV